MWKQMVPVVALLVMPGCKKSAPDSATDGRIGGERCAKLNDLSDVMHCELAPYMNGTLHDEAAFRKALTQLRDLAPSDPEFYPSDRPWPAIVDDMLATNNYKQGCGDCHRHFQKLYKSRFEGSQVPWTDVHGPPPDAAR